MRVFSSLKKMAVELGGMAARCFRFRNDSGRETPVAILLQVLFPFTVAGMGMVAAGFVFDYVDKWKVFHEISEIIVMIPALLGLKGNLEMTLAARLSTASNLGRLDRLGSACSIIMGNLALLQCQGTVLGCLVAVGAVVVGVITDGPEPVKLDHALVLLSSAMLTASICSAVLGVIMVAVIVGARKLNINPDNVATPIAAALGDITSLGLLAHLVSALHNEVSAGRFTAHAIIGCYSLVALASGYIAWRNRNTRAVMVGGWVPVLLAMTISSGAGVVLERAAGQFDVMTQFQTVFNGVGGNLAAIQASRISTSLHSSDMEEKLLESEKRASSREGPSRASSREGPAQSSFMSEKSGSSVRTDSTSATTLPDAQNLDSSTEISPDKGRDNPSFTPPSDTVLFNDSPQSLRTVKNIRKSSVSLPTNPTPRTIVKAETANTSLPPFLPTNSKKDSAINPSFLMTSINTSSKTEEAVNASTPISRRTSYVFVNESGSTNVSSSESQADEDDFHPNQLFLVRGGSHAATARLLLLLVPPGHGLFLYMFVLIQNDSGPGPTPLFVVMFLLSTLVQVTILLQVTQMLVCWFWNRGTDPDSSAIPYLTALGDLLGVSLLTMTCYLLQFAQDVYVLHDSDAVPNSNDLTTLPPDINMNNLTTIFLNNDTTTLRHNLL